MIRPSTLLLWFAGTAAGGAALLYALAPQATAFTLAILATALLLPLLDAFAVLRRQPLPIQAVPHEGTRQTKDRPGRITLSLSGTGPALGTVRVALPLPPSVSVTNEILKATLPPGPWKQRHTWDITPHKRGLYPLNALYITRNSPLKFWELRRAIPLHAELRVYPNLLGERRRLAALFMNRGLSGLHAQRRVGRGRDFEQLREYIPGDSYEDIHWKATARRRLPVTKIYQVERTQEVYVLLDTSRLSGRTIRTETGAQESQLERYIDAALVLAMVTQKQGDLFGLITFSDHVHGFARARAGRQHFGTCRDVLYMLEPQPVNPDFEELFTFIRLRLRKRSLLIILTNLDDPALAESFTKNAQRLANHHLLLVHTITPPGANPIFHGPAPTNTHDIYRNLAGHLQWRALHELQRELHRLGATMTLSNSAALTPEIITQYVNVKQRQAL